MTPLMHAAFTMLGDSIDTVNALVCTYNANMEAVDSEGKTALVHATEQGHTDTANALRQLKETLTAASPSPSPSAPDQMTPNDPESPFRGGRAGGFNMGSTGGGGTGGSQSERRRGSRLRR